MKKAVVWLLAFMLAAAITLSLDTHSASAHAFLLRSDPEDGSVLASPPKQMRFWFSEAPEINFTVITIQDASGHSWQLQPYPDIQNQSAIVVNLPNLPPSAYRVVWRTVSDEDLHVVSGSVVFGINQSVNREQSGQAQSATPVAEVLFHWISLLAFATVTGALSILLFVLPGIRKNAKEEQTIVLASLQRKILLLAWWCSIIALLSGLFTLLAKSLNVQAGSLSNRIINWQLISSSLFIQRDLMSEAILLVTASLILIWLKQQAGVNQSQKGYLRNILLLSLTTIWIFFQALNSHASAFNDFSATRIIIYALHILGTGLWIGGQVALIFFVAPQLKAPNKEYMFARAIYTRFGGIAVIGVAILIVTGLYSAGQQVATLDALLLTPYGRAVVFKSGLVLMIGLIGFWHSSIFHPKVGRVLFKVAPYRIVLMMFGKANPVRTLRVQLLGGAGIFLLAAFMGSTQPARGPEFEAPAQTSSAAAPQASSRSSLANDLLINFSIKPNQPGQNFINVGVFDTRRPAPAPIDQVVVTLLPPNAQNEIQINVPASGSGSSGNYQISTDMIDKSGDWKVSVVVHRKGIRDTVLGVPWTVASSAPIAASSRPIFISNRPLAPLLTMASLLLSILFGVAWLVITLKPDLFYWSDRKTASQEVNL